MEFEEKEHEDDRRYIVLLFTAQDSDPSREMEQIIDEVGYKVDNRVLLLKVGQYFTGLGGWP